MGFMLDLFEFDNGLHFAQLSSLSVMSWVANRKPWPIAVAQGGQPWVHDHLKLDHFIQKGKKKKHKNLLITPPITSFYSPPSNINIYQSTILMSPISRVHPQIVNGVPHIILNLVYHRTCHLYISSLKNQIKCFS